MTIATEERLLMKGAADHRLITRDYFASGDAIERPRTGLVPVAISSRLRYRSPLLLYSTIPRARPPGTLQEQPVASTPGS